MPDDSVLTEKQLEEALEDLPDWEVRDGWLRRKYTTPGFTHTMMLVNTIGYLAEAAWHHPDMSIGYAHVTVKLQTHRVRAVTPNDIALASKIHETVTWLPTDDSPLDGFPKKWVR
jgi:4a-hydroxytetrahydrobiopterin dehydratase